jgi:hypothetical protein
MSNPDMWEKQLQSWSPRPPSDRVARQLFENGASHRAARAVAPIHRIEFWNWLTPVAACCLTMIVLCSGVNRRAVPLQGRDNASYFATLMLSASASNVTPQTFELSKVDENIEWNVWPHASLPTTNFSYVRNGLSPVSNSINGIFP